MFLSVPAMVVSVYFVTALRCVFLPKGVVGSTPKCRWSFEETPCFQHGSCRNNRARELTLSTVSLCNWTVSVTTDGIIDPCSCSITSLVVDRLHTCTRGSIPLS